MRTLQFDQKSADELGGSMSVGSAVVAIRPSDVEGSATMDQDTQELRLLCSRIVESSRQSRTVNARSLMPAKTYNSSQAATLSADETRTLKQLMHQMDQIKQPY